MEDQKPSYLKPGDFNQKNPTTTYNNGFMKEGAENKPRIDLLDPKFIQRIGLRAEIGARKYSEDNWKDCHDANLYRAAAMRHIFQWLNKDSDEDHAAAAAWNIMAYEYLSNKRSSPPNIQSALSPTEMEKLRQLAS